MNKEHRGILYGMVLGDGCLYKTKRGHTTLTIGHSPKQKEYLEHKIDLLYSVFGGIKPKIYEYTSFNKRQNKSYTNIQTVKMNKYFAQMHRVLCRTGSKKYSRQALDYLTDHGLALWFCDDGSGTLCRNKNGNISGCMIRISTYCSLEEANTIKGWFIDKYQIEPKFDVDKRNNKYSIRFNTKESRKFVSIVSKFIPDCMKYKIDIIQERKTSSRDEDIV